MSVVPDCVGAGTSGVRGADNAVALGARCGQSWSYWYLLSEPPGGRIGFKRSQDPGWGWLLGG
jgi:hypothetical protein